MKKLVILALLAVLSTPVFASCLCEATDTTYNDCNTPNDCKAKHPKACPGNGFDCAI